MGRPFHKIGKEDIRVMVDMAKHEVPRPVIAELFGIDPSTVSYHVLRSGGVRRIAGGRKTKNKPPKPPTYLDYLQKDLDRRKIKTMAGDYLKRQLRVL